MNRIFIYALAVAAARKDVQVHGYILLSDHFHIVLTDVLGRMGEFTALFDWILTKCVQELRGWKGRIFDGHGVRETTVLDAAATLRELAYTLTNGVRHGLVDSSSKYPGACSSVADIDGAPIVGRRPRVFFKEGGKMPETCELRLKMPRTVLEAHDEGHARHLLEVQVERCEKRARRAVKAAGRTFMGAAKLLRQSPFARVRQGSVSSPLPRWAGSRARVETARERRSQFLERYAKCRSRWLEGERAVVWPAGTDLMRRRHGVTCEAP